MCVLRSVKVWQGNPGDRLAPKIDTPVYPVLYARPMDDDLEHWHRLCGEVWAMGHEDPEIRAAAGDHKLRHAGGATHPHYQHMRLGGDLSWVDDQPAHPAIQEHALWVAGLSHRDFVEHFMGKNMFRSIE